MNIQSFQKKLTEWDRRGVYVFSRHMLSRMLQDGNDKTLSKTLARMVAAGLIDRACRGVYVNPNARSMDGFQIEHVAIALRPVDYNYVSLESALSEEGVISQIPVGTLTVMTTGRKSRVKTIYGIIEFTNTARGTLDILDGIVRIPGRPLRVAAVKTAWRDLLRARSRDHAERMVDLGELDRAINTASPA